jgi:hypothetical protein
MPFIRSFAAGALFAGAVSGCAIAGCGIASAASVTPVSGGWQIDLNHGETVLASKSHLGMLLSRLPNAAAGSFGRTLDTLSGLAARYPAGRVSISVFGPVDNFSGTMTAFAD